jgi:N-acyl-D-aspartate/D-glutamate deacylase
MDYDLKITGGTLVDGTGSPARRADVGVRAGRVVALGEAPGTASRTLDAEGRVVAPGFVDIHTHYDAQVFWDRMLTISPWHGVTSVVMGNCGFGVAPTRPEHRSLIIRTLEKVEGMSVEALETGLGEDWPFETFPQFLDAIESRGTAINVGALVGHTPVRLYVMGEDATERAATREEISRMRAIVREALEAGAIGFATSKAPTHVGYGGRPVPSRLSELDEIQALAGTLGELSGGILQATVGRGLFFEEFAGIARETGRPVSWTALLAGMGGPGLHRAFLERSLNFEFQFKEPFVFESMSLFQPVSAADLEGKARIYRDPEFRRAFREKTGESGGGALGASWERTWISSCPSEPALEERRVDEVARERGTTPVDLALDLALDSNLEARFRMAIFNTNEDEVEELIRSPHTILGLSDAGAHASQLCDACFSTHLLGHWVREKQSISLEQAVHMLTAQVCEVFDIRDRGRLAQGLPADVVVFDPDTVGASGLRRVYDFPAGADRLVSDASGIEAVIVSGVPIRIEGHDVVDPEGELPGQVLRGSAT